MNSFESREAKSNLEDTLNQPANRIGSEAIELASKILHCSKHEFNSKRNAYHLKMSRLVESQEAKKFLFILTDSIYRNESSSEIQSFRKLVKHSRIPNFFSTFEIFMLKIGAFVSNWFPEVILQIIRYKIQRDSRQVILPFTELSRRTRNSLNQNKSLNFNLLGEAILSEKEAHEKIQQFKELLEKPEVNYVSIKISNLYSQINPIAHQSSLKIIKNRLRYLFKIAIQVGNKFVNLDMEANRDLHLSIQAFKEVLDEEEFKDFRAGIVLQAYIPESFDLLKELTAWARIRNKQGGAPIKVRIVKGANLSMERVTSSLEGWDCPIYKTKTLVDANYKRMLQFSLTKTHAIAANIGIASHNLFDLAYALILIQKESIQPFCEIEMLHGMAENQSNAILKFHKSLLLYTPIVKKENFKHAIAYLIRRLEENTTEGNFLRDSFQLNVGSEKWNLQVRAFQSSIDEIPYLTSKPLRNQQKLWKDALHSKSFKNIPNTDWSLPSNQKNLQKDLASWTCKLDLILPIQVNGKEIIHTKMNQGYSPNTGQMIYKYCSITLKDWDSAIQAAQEAFEDWKETCVEYRKEVLIKSAVLIQKNRSKFLEAMRSDTAKSIHQSDIEIHECIDFANYYARSWDSKKLYENTQFIPLGPTLIASPWNFPLAIPAGGIFASLMAGNTVLFKPSHEAIWVGWELINILWKAGIPKKALQFIPAQDEIGKSIISDKRLKGVLLTGSYQTAQKFLDWRPTLKLLAETSGNNSIIVTPNADYELAIKDIIESAFIHSGQKCSACSLLILVGFKYDAFLSTLKEATESLPCGSSLTLKNIVTPLIKEPDENLLKALTVLEKNEEWLLQPRKINGKKNLWSPGIRLHVKPGSFLHRTECFGPVLGIMKAESLQEALDWANDNEYALTAGLESLDPEEQSIWSEKIQAGNLYINRTITGAIVGRQPFGGWKKSAIGCSSKTGGPHYVSSLGTLHNIEEKDPPNKGSSTEIKEQIDLMGIEKSDPIIQSLEFFYDVNKNHFSLTKPSASVLGENNCTRFVKRSRILFRIGPKSQKKSILILIFASKITKIPFIMSQSPSTTVKTTGLPIVLETEKKFSAFLNHYENQNILIRTDHKLSKNTWKEANRYNFQIQEGPILLNPYQELRHFYLEQSISQTTHRYGNLLKS